MQHDRPLYVRSSVSEQSQALQKYLCEFFADVRPFDGLNWEASEPACVVLEADGPSALVCFHESRQKDKHVAFVIVGGQEQFESAIALLQAGAEEFVQLNEARDFANLPTAINRAIKKREKNLALERARNDALHHALTLATILNHVHDAVLSFDADGSVLLFNKQAEHIFGYSASEMLKQPVLMLFPDHLHQDAWEIFTGSHSVTQEHFEFMALKLDGTTFPVEMSCQRIRLSGRDQFVMTLEDISDRKAVEAALHFHIALESFISNVATDLINRASAHIHSAIDEALASVGKMCQLHRAYLLLEDVHQQFSCVNEWHAENTSSVKQQWQSLRRGAAPELAQQLMNGEVVLIEDAATLPAGRQRAMLRKRKIATLVAIPLRIGGQVQGVLGLETIRRKRAWSTTEVAMLTLLAAVFANAFARQRRERALEALSSELADANVRLHQQARKDSLTGLSNRRHFDDVMEHEYRRALREQKPLAVLICDVDFFKSYNDFYGHPAGDACLVKVGLVLAENFQRSADLCARYGGEEFVVIMAGLDAEKAFLAAERARQRLLECALPHAKGVNGFVTASFGIAALDPNRPLDIKELLKQADNALYQAKKNGRNQTVGADSLTPLLAPKQIDDSLSA